MLVGVTLAYFAVRKDLQVGGAISVNVLLGPKALGADKNDLNAV